MCIRDTTGVVPLRPTHGAEQHGIRRQSQAFGGRGQRDTRGVNRAAAQERRFELKHVPVPVSYTHLRAHETVLDLVCRLLLEKKNNTPNAVNSNNTIVKYTSIKRGPLPRTHT